MKRKREQLVEQELDVEFLYFGDVSIGEDGPVLGTAKTGAMVAAIVFETPRLAPLVVVRIGMSFCSPKEKSWNDLKARQIAVGRALKVGTCVIQLERRDIMPLLPPECPCALVVDATATAEDAVVVVFRHHQWGSEGSSLIPQWARSWRLHRRADTVVRMAFTGRTLETHANARHEASKVSPTLPPSQAPEMSPTSA